MNCSVADYILSILYMGVTFIFIYCRAVEFDYTALKVFSIFCLPRVL